VDTIKKNVLEALEASFGVVTDACKAADCPRSTFYKWLSEDEEFKAAVNEIQNVSLDFAESKLFKKIKDEDTTSIIFYLKTKGKKRGYIEKQEIEHSGKVGVTLIEDDADERDEPITD
jgi:hypothetical protein